MDGAVFPQPLWRSEQEEPFGIQGVFGGELQTTNSEPALTRNQQVPRVYKTGKAESEVRESTAKELLGKCNQRCRLQISQSPAQSRWLR